jgi:hypothetical protein
MIIIFDLLSWAQLSFIIIINFLFLSEFLVMFQLFLLIFKLLLL